MPDGRNLGSFIRTSREAAGLSQGDVAKALGYTTRQFVSNWERGISSPPLKMLKKLAGLLGIDPDELYQVVLDDALVRVEQQLHDQFYGKRNRKKPASG